MAELETVDQERAESTCCSPSAQETCCDPEAVEIQETHRVHKHAASAIIRAQVPLDPG